MRNDLLTRAIDRAVRETREAVAAQRILNERLAELELLAAISTGEPWPRLTLIQGGRR